MYRTKIYTTKCPCRDVLMFCLCILSSLCVFRNKCKVSYSICCYYIFTYIFMHL